MRNIYGIGETLLDIIFKNSQPQAAKPGGAMLNSTVSLGRIALPVYLISEYADDDVGSMIDKFLHENGVGTTYVDHYKDGKTALAIAVLNEKNDASYTFYKNYPSKRLEMTFPVIRKDDIVLCGSIYAITTEIAHTPDEAWKIVSKYCPCLVYTASSESVHVRTVSFSGRFPVKKIKAVSTIGAGDNFNAGMIKAVYRNHITRDQLVKIGEEEWSKIVASGVDFASDVCMSYENYISQEFARKVK
ncbi:MAG: PfkB family carbohydrate kinase [Bacteroidia bacterium]|nr:PfkB family carbohydrate kinase [Bacteroidia bacterium]